MWHFDGHEDMDLNKTFNLEEYQTIIDDFSKQEYLIRRTSISNWQIVLLQLGIIDESFWRFVFPFTDGWLFFPKNKATQKIVQERKNYSNYRLPPKGSVDIDIDMFHELDTRLSSSAKEKVLRGIIPQEIQQMITSMVERTGHAKVFTVASSPAYIHQRRGLIYIQEFLRKLREFKTDKGYELSIQFQLAA